MATAESFAYKQYRDFVIYSRLAASEKNPEFRAALESLIDQEKEDFAFWQKLSQHKEFSVPAWQVWYFFAIRKIFGLTFTARLLEGREKKMIVAYSHYLMHSAPELKQEIHRIIQHEQYHEQQLIAQIKEDKIEFLGNIILGLNDGLIELTGALVGFAFALSNHFVVAAAGFIAGIAATLSMASSAYMQAQYEEGRDARKSALYTGVAYLVVVLLLVAPFLIFAHSLIAITMTIAIVIVIIAAISWYTAILFERKFFTRFFQMLLFTLGVAAISFGIATSVRLIFGIEI